MSGNISLYWSTFLPWTSKSGIGSYVSGNRKDLTEKKDWVAKTNS